MKRGRVVLLTGAGSGIGRAAASQLRGEGMRLVLVGRRSEQLEQTVAAWSDSEAVDADTMLLPADLSRPDEPGRIVAKTIERFGRLDGLVNNAGLAEMVPIEGNTPEVLDRALGVNLIGPALLIAAAWSHFQQQGAGCVVNISSMSTVDPFPGLSAYAAAKAGLESLTRSIMNEGGSFGMRAFTIAPGSVETAMLRGLVREDDLPRDRTLDPASVAAVIVDCLVGRREKDCGKVVYLASP